MYLIDTNAISELRKGPKADPGVTGLLKSKEDELFIPVQVVGELNFGIESLKRRGDHPQAESLQRWLGTVLDTFEGRILSFDQSCALVWGKLRSSSDQNLIDKQIAAIALVYDLAVVTRNTRHYDGTGVSLLNPFFADRVPDAPKN